MVAPGIGLGPMVTQSSTLREEGNFLWPGGMANSAPFYGWEPRINSFYLLSSTLCKKQMGGKQNENPQTHPPFNELSFLFHRVEAGFECSF